MKYRKVFGDEQLVIAERGTEKVVHILRSAIDVHRDDEDFIVVTIDVHNCYNSFHRDFMLQAVKEKFPGLARFTAWKYIKSIPLYLRNGKVITSQSGGKQGDGLMGVCHGAADLKIVEAIRSKFKIVTPSYADDRYVAGHWSEVLEFFRELKPLCAA